MQRVKEMEARQFVEQPKAIEVAPEAFASLTGELSAAWHAPNVSMRARQQLLRTLIIDIVADVDDETREVIVTGAKPRAPSCGIDLRASDRQRTQGLFSV